MTFYGVRGSCPCAGDRYRRVGGNTACTAVSVNGETPLVLDLGTGVRALGDLLCETARQEGRPLRVSALLTHLHFDHVMGLPFFTPLLVDPESALTIYGPPQDGASLRDTLASVVQPPFFPIQLKDLPGELDVREVMDEELAIGPFTVRAARIPHPGTTLGFRIQCGSTSLAYLPDHQAPGDRRSVAESVRQLCDGVDLLLHDAQYTDDEFSAKSAWGHSTVAYAVRVAAECGVGRLVLFHHDPLHSDREIGVLLRQAQRLPDASRLDDVSVAVEGGSVTL